ncbi:multidrug MFS transporter (plasmid) [Ralstonia syzygii]|uniref:Multidrug MFS transporter n=1 Tax=Ralstonia syzygii TaxID=28097 RepID=A0ABX7ZJE9_9RALS|nr:EpsG family protein [Ralstonia syzygii]QUP55573.1 multidrug MFS transporter [Ralstonia syzygii]
MKYSASIRLNALGAIASQHGVLVVIGMLLFVPMAFPLLPIAATYCAAILAILLPLGRLQHVLATGSSVAFAWLLTLRNPARGLVEAGLGDDALHYMNAFYEFQQAYCCSPLDVLKTGIRSAGGGEPIFWYLSYAVAKLFDTPLLVWAVLIFISLMLVWIAIYRSTDRFAYVVFVAYLSTITLYALQGSAIRQAVATGLVMVALDLLIRRKLVSAAGVGLIAAGTHSSAAVLLLVCSGVVLFLSRDYGMLARRSSWLGRVGRLVVLLTLAVAAAIFGSAEFVVSKIQARLSESQTGSAWEIQLATESVLACLLAWLFRMKLPREEKVAYLAFVLICFSTSFFAPAVGARLFRYTYCFYIVYLCAFFFARQGESLGQKKTLASLLLLASLGWAFYIVNSRYQGLFVSGGVIDHFLAGPFF